MCTLIVQDFLEFVIPKSIGITATSTDVTTKIGYLSSTLLNMNTLNSMRDNFRELLLIKDRSKKLGKLPIVHCR